MTERQKDVWSGILVVALMVGILGAAGCCCGWRCTSTAWRKSPTLSTRRGWRPYVHVTGLAMVA